MPDTENVVQLSKLFGVSTDYLLNDEFESVEDSIQANSKIPEQIVSDEGDSVDETVPELISEIANEVVPEPKGEITDEVVPEPIDEITDEAIPDLKDEITALSLDIKRFSKSPVFWIIIAAVIVLNPLSILLLTRQLVRSSDTELPPGIGIVTPTPEQQAPIDNGVITTEPLKQDIQAVSIMYIDRQLAEFTFQIGEIVPLNVRIEPEGTEGEIVWTSSDKNVFEVKVTGLSGVDAQVTATGQGTAMLVVTIDGIEAECVVIVR